MGKEDPLESCTLIKAHDRMPVILDPPDYDAWLDLEQQDVAYMLDQLPPDRMSVRP